MLNVSKLFVQTPQQYFTFFHLRQRNAPFLLKSMYLQHCLKLHFLNFCLHAATSLLHLCIAAFPCKSTDRQRSPVCRRPWRVHENGCTSFAMISMWILIARVIVYCRRNSTGLLYPAERRSPSASRSLRTVRPPWFCSWLMSPWTDSPIPQPELDPHSTKPRARCPGPPCFPRESRAHAHTCECTWNDNEWKMWHFRTRAITVSKQVSLIALLHLLLSSAIGQANG